MNKQQSYDAWIKRLESIEMRRGLKRDLELTSVQVKWDRERKAKIVAKGDQVSEIKWLDTGLVQAISNDQLDFSQEKREK
jgi:hypothetical protein